MKQLLFTLYFLICCFVVSAQNAKKYRQSYNSYIELDCVDMILIPVAWDNNAKVGDVKIQGVNRTQNILFYNPTNDYLKFLFNDRMQIIENYSGHLLYNRSDDDSTKRPPNKDYLYFSIINEDYNNDNKLDTSDPSYLYSSKFDGSELTLLTPKHYDLKKYRYLKRPNIMLATLVSDENKDKKFNNNDSEILYKVDLNDLSKSKIISKLKIKSDAD